MAISLLSENEKNYKNKINHDHPYLLANIAFIYDFQGLFYKSNPYHMRLVNPDYDISFLDNDFKISILNNAG